jgi:UDP-N-acetylmuramoyl-tripeptide--D-alanyl-D-alanine ligase
MDAVQVFKSLNDASEVLWKLAKPGDVVIFENDLPDNYNE